MPVRLWLVRGSRGRQFTFPTEFRTIARRFVDGELVRGSRGVCCGGAERVLSGMGGLEGEKKKVCKYNNNPNVAYTSYPIRGRED